MEVKVGSVRIKELIFIFLKIGTIGFGGGVAMLALIRKYFVLEKKWITDDDLAKAITLGQMIPGPFVPNYVEYIGYRIRGLKGMLFSVIAFLMPGFFAMLILCYLYFQTRNILVVNDIFIWIQPIIIGILSWASFDMGKLYLRDSKSVAIALFALFASFFKIVPIITIIICGVFGIILHKRPKIYTILPIFLIAATDPFHINVTGLGTLIVIFLEIGALIFGGGYAAIPFIAKEVVILRPWLTNQELLTGVALSQITPGPVALLSTFVGYKISGIVGAIVATIAIFLPSTIILILILMFYRYFRWTKGNKISNYAKRFISGVKPAIIGFLVSASAMLAINNGVLITNSILISLLKIFLVIISFILLVQVKISPVWLISGSAIVGFVLTKVLYYI